ncbi:MAG: 23S rRNA (pseudouridine(1915)-N(3))-methyltransferase RlmH, partial [Lachnospiraceae bacterium]|nr:23S rRNA (pseudouridine(1915)-N(3))-methyltransferase RlmH [Lachnospiraceae bacterium]
MKVTILCVGKIKEKFYREAIAEFEKRLSRYCTLEIVEVADEQTPDGASQALQDQIKEKEGERLLSKIKEDAYIVTLEILGKKLTSEKFSAFLEDAMVKGKGQVVFVIGG